MMEMKLKAQTSIEQYLKYCTLIALEEMTSGRKAEVGLVYLVPADAVGRTRQVLLLDDQAARDQIWEEPSAFTDKATLLQLLRRHREEIASVGSRLKTDVMTWDEFLAITTQTHDIAAGQGDETLANLMQGLVNQISGTPDCGLTCRPCTMGQ